MKITLEDLRKAAEEIRAQVGDEMSKYPLSPNFTRVELENWIHTAELCESFDEEELTEETQAIFWGTVNGDVGYAEEGDKDLTQLN